MSDADDRRLNHTWQTVLTRHKLGKTIDEICQNSRHQDGSIHIVAESLGISLARVGDYRRVAQTFTEKHILQLLEHGLTWQHFVILCRVPKRDFRSVLKQVVKNKFSTRDLEKALNDKYGRLDHGRGGGRRKKKRPRLEGL